MKNTLITLLLGLLTCSANAQTTDNPCNNWFPYHIKTTEEIDLKGTILLYKNHKGQIYNPLNLAIIKHSEYLASLKESATSVQKFAKFFSTGEIENTSNAFAEVSTQVIYCSKNILTYQIRSAVLSRRDLGSPYYEYLTINLNDNTVIKANDVIANGKTDELKLFIKNYANAHQKSVVQTHSNTISERQYDIYNPIEEVKNYNYQYVAIHLPQTIELVCIRKNGIEFEIEATDKNYKKYKSERGHYYQFYSSITIPYEQLKPFLNPKSAIFKDMPQQ